MRIVDVDAPGPLLDAVHRDVVAPAFPPAELVGLDELRDVVGSGAGHVVATLDDDGAPVAAAVAEWSPASEIVLLAYLAVKPGLRSTGLGGQLLDHSTRRWRELWQPAAVLAEIEHPAGHGASEAYGDPAKRLRFYARHGVRGLDVPYFQPSLGPGLDRVFGLILSLIWMGDKGAGAQPSTVDGERVTRFVAEYLEGCEGSVGSDPATTAMFAALRRPGGIALLPFDDPAGLPCSVRPAG